MKKLLKSKVAVLFTIMLSLFTNVSAQAKVTETGLAEETQNGAILHAWCWSFNTIKKNMSEIAAAGFSAIQTSPISQCLVGDDGGLEIMGKGKWYFHYQPTKYVVGNYQLGTEKEFIAMCEEAHKYGIKIIVDTVINHCTATWNAIDEGLKNIEGDGFHAQDGYWSETDRFEETQYALSGLWDLNTQNPKVQQLILDFLKRCVEDGADGFRYDAAKLIELPDDVTSHPEKYNGTVKTQPHKYTVEKFTSNFWPTVLANGASFQYGEVLQEGGNIKYSADMKSGYDDELSSRLASYHRYMKTTNSMYGFRVREASKTDNFNAAFVTDYVLPKGAKPENVVTWVESHDNFCNDASYKELDEQEVIRAWAVIASRKSGTPLFFDRPMGSTKNNPWGENKIQAAGSNMFKDRQVVEVNFFRNAMAGSDEALSNPTGENEVLFIERGNGANSGVVIINASDKAKNFDGVPVKLMADGEYKEHVRGSTITVKGGKLYGTIEAETVGVAYNKTAKPLEFRSEIECSVPSGYFLDDFITVGVKIRGCTDATYTLGKTTGSLKDGDKLVIGKDLGYGKTETLTISAKDSSGKKITKKYTYKKVLHKKNTIVYFDSKMMGPDWPHDRVCAYAYNEGGVKNNGSWPGVEMENLGNGLYRYILPYELENQKTYIIFNNGNGGAKNQYPNGAGLDMYRGTQMILQSDGSWKPYK